MLLTSGEDVSRDNHGTVTQQNKKEDIEKNKNKSSSKKFTPPTLEEVEEYINEKGYNIRASKFVDYYTSNGWKVGKNPMKDWKAAVRSWAHNDYDSDKKKVKSFADMAMADWRKLND